MDEKELGRGGEHRPEHSWFGDWHRGPPGWCRRLRVGVEGSVREDWKSGARWWWLEGSWLFFMVNRKGQKRGWRQEERKKCTCHTRQREEHGSWRED